MYLVGKVSQILIEKVAIWIKRKFWSTPFVNNLLKN